MKYKTRTKISISNDKNAIVNKGKIDSRMCVVKECRTSVKVTSIYTEYLWRKW